MNTERVAQLEKMRKESPDDPFLLYALAMEHIHQNKKQASELFTKLLLDHPDYLPTYYQSAELFVELDDKERAIDIFNKGIDLARRLSESKTLAELQNAYQNFLVENDG